MNLQALIVLVRVVLLPAAYAASMLHATEGLAFRQMPQPAHTLWHSSKILLFEVYWLVILFHVCTVFFVIFASASNTREPSIQHSCRAPLITHDSEFGATQQVIQSLTRTVTLRGL